MTYTVKNGDTLYGISNQFGVSANDIYTLNNLKSTTIYPGDVLKIPTVSGSNPSSTFTYTVVKGDSLYNIARRYETTVNAIVELNNLKSTNLAIGQQLQIPETGHSVSSLPTFTTYTVKRGDTLYGIARNNNISVNELIKDNNLSSTTLSIGQVLKIRTGKTIIVEECYGEDYTPVDNSIIYTVVKGDSLWKIANKFNTSVSSIKNKNNLASDNLSIGQKLKI